MADSTHPMYRKGFRAGRAITEAEMAETRRLNDRMTSQARVEWNQTFNAVLTGLFATASTWRLDSQPVTDIAGRVQLAKRAADQAAKVRPK